MSFFSLLLSCRRHLRISSINDQLAVQFKTNRFIIMWLQLTCLYQVYIALIAALPSLLLIVGREVTSKKHVVKFRQNHLKIAPSSFRHSDVICLGYIKGELDKTSVKFYIHVLQRNFHVFLRNSNTACIIIASSLFYQIKRQVYLATVTHLNYCIHSSHVASFHCGLWVYAATVK